MTEEHYDETMAELARTAEMDAETVAALERRLLQAFTEHHAVGVPAGTDARSIEMRGGAGVQRRPCSSSSSPGLAAWRALRVASPGVEVREMRCGAGASAGCDRRDERASVPPAVPAKPARRPRPAPQVVRPAPFVALPGAAGLPEFESGTIVRLELSLASLPSYGVDITRAGADRPVEADVLVGQDGQARAIRLVSSGNARPSRSQQ